MKKTVVLFLATLAIAGGAWATNAFSKYETNVPTTRTAPSGTQTDAGVNPAGPLGVTTSVAAHVCAEPGVIITAAGEIDFHQKGASGLWARVPALDVPIQQAGERCWTGPALPLPYPAGLVAFVPNGVVLGGATDGGNTLTLYYQFVTDGPGAQTPRPASSAVSVSNFLLDSSNRPYVLPVQALCSTYAQSVVAVGAAGVAVPTSATSGRRGVTICNSTENTGSPKLKCLVDSQDGGPGLGLTLPGDVLAVGDCITYPVDNITSTRCISDTAGTAATATECIPAQ